MKLIAKIIDKDFDQSFKRKKDKSYIFREAVRAVITREDGKIALMQVSNKGYYKLPGGGIDTDEDPKQALDREVREETGCKARIGETIGMVLEVRNCPEEENGLVQVSYAYKAEFISRGENKLTKKEQEDGFEFIWVTVMEAIKLLKSSKVEEDYARFIVKRDLEILKSV
jgi:ADP-ribose pyrophosphatase YjhB (NUDIX family)